ncbi:TRAP transporter small permease [Brevibacillus nitrificans]|uniref:TRAP transporter small permease n=1 Tax=Brevibacillus nitrificans TaxID=651560 RepID=UPI0028633091|nr:TRAP transporter small permease [Brevibacillus nitrificans]MDR7314727.1 TRAP-type C4-dicarboxylate transport system permease small subunit [Brevibacillus nitrificans]
MTKILSLFSKFTDVLMAICLTSMAILVFGNVVLRYAFDAGIPWSEEMSRFFFVWLTFLGAIGALKDNSHLGVDMFIKKLPRQAKRLCYVISNLIVLYVLWLVFDGSWKSTSVSTNAHAPATGLPMSYIYGIGVVMSVGMGIIVLYNLYLALFLKDGLDQLLVRKDSEEETLLENMGTNQKQSLTGGNP